MLDAKSAWPLRQDDPHELRSVSHSRTTRAHGDGVDRQWSYMVGLSPSPDVHYYIRQTDRIVGRPGRSRCQRQTDGRTNGQTDRQTRTKRDVKTIPGREERMAPSQGRQTDRETDRQTDRDRQTDSQTDRDRQTDSELEVSHSVLRCRSRDSETQMQALLEEYEHLPVHVCVLDQATGVLTPLGQ